MDERRRQALQSVLHMTKNAVQHVFWSIIASQDLSDVKHEAAKLLKWEVGG